jgi:hypothetical protein
MPSEILEKIQKLSPALRDRLSDDKYLAKLDKLEVEFGVKAVIILLQLLLKEISYDSLKDYLIKEYGFNSFLADQVKERFGELIIELENIPLEAVVTPEIEKSEKKIEEPIPEESNKMTQQGNEIKTASFSTTDQPALPQSLTATTPTSSPVSEKNNISNGPEDIFGDAQAVSSTSAPVIKQPSASGFVKRAAASVTFSREDEEEIKKISPLQSNDKINYEAIAGKIASGFVFSEKDEFLVNRLKNIIIARLKDVRDDLETKDNLTKEQGVGGLGITSGEADNLIKIIKEAKKSGSSEGIGEMPPKVFSSLVNKTKVSDSIKQNLPIFIEEDGVPVVKLPQDMMKIDEFLPAEQKVKSEKAETKAEILPIEPKNDIIKTMRDDLASLSSDTSRQNKATDFKEDPQPRPLPYVASSDIPATVINNKNLQKPSLDDVNFKKQSFGPIEELENMTIIEFRRISADPRIAVNKVKEKIDLLENQGFGKRVEGIDAWHKSEVNRFYRLLGQASMSEGKPIEEIIRSRLLSGKPTLSFDEFEVIMELNRQLRF